MSQSLALSLRNMTPTDRLGLLNDTFALAKAGKLPITEALELTRHYREEDNYFVASALSSNLHSIARVHSQQPYYASLLRYFRSLFTYTFSLLGWDLRRTGREDHLTAQFRSTVISVLAWTEDPSILDQAQKRFAKFIEDPHNNAIPADLRSSVYAIAIRYGGATAYQNMLQLYRQSDLSEEKVRALDAIGRVTDEAMIRKTLLWALSDEVRSQDVMIPIGSLAAGPIGREIVWKHFKDNYSAFMNRFGKSNFLIPRIISSIANGFVTSVAAKDVEDFFRANPCPPAQRTITQILETIRFNATRLEREREAVAQWAATNKL